MRRALLVLLSTAALASGAAAQTQVLVISGLGGEPRFSDRFRTMGRTLVTALVDRYHVDPAGIAWFGEDSVVRDPRYRGQALRDAIERAVTAMRGRAKAGEQVVIVLIGHGAGSDQDSRLSIPGPDITVTDVKRWVDGFAEQRVAVVNLSSGSGDWMGPLAAPGRVVITATKTSFERNESHFGEFFVKALAEDGADVDKDGRVSLLEAFQFAARETKRLYDDATKIQTEHAQLDDNGTRQNATEPTGRNGQGLLARRFFFDAHTIPASAAGDATLAALYRERLDLEVAVDSVRSRKAEMPAAAYETELERALIALARKSRQIRTAEGRP